jgi:hypothetical protein
MKKSHFLIVVFLLLAAVCHAQSRAKYEPAGDTVLHGAGLPGYWSDPQLRAQYEQFKKYSGKRTAVVTWFASQYENGRMTSWRQSYALNLERVRRLKSVSLIKFSTQDSAFARTKKQAGLKEIARGVYDAYYQEFADTVKDFRDPVFISIDHEMNGNWFPYSQDYPGSDVTAADYIAAWKHIVDIFRARGATNVAWVWSPNVPDVGSTPATKYYPGDDYVDWIGVSFYSGNNANALDAIYTIYAPRKPFFITEWATAQEQSRYYADYPGDAQWVEQFFHSLNTKYPRVKAISWFQYDKEDGNFLLQRVDEQQREYSSEAAAPRYSEDAGTLVSKNPGGVERVPVRVVPNETFLQQKPAVINPKPQAPRRAVPLSERVQLENVKTQR